MFFPEALLFRDNVTGKKQETSLWRRDAGIWGRFKPDYAKGYSDLNYNKRVSTASLTSQDLWNLREIETPIGAKIKIAYEPDSYAKPKMFNNYSYTISSMTPVASSSTDVTLGILPPGDVDLPSIFTVGSKCNFIALLQTSPASGTAYEELLDYSTVKAEIIAATSSTITVRAYGLATKVNGCYTADFSEPGAGTCSNTFIGGKLKYYKGTSTGGGGLRVKNLTVEGSGLKKETIFTYESTPGVTSGVTSFEPYGFDQYSLAFPASLSGVSEAERVKKKTKGTDAFLKVLYREYSDVLKLSRIIPAPGVMYEYVTVTQKSNNVEYPSKTKYQFQVFDNDMISISQNPVPSDDPGNSSNHRLNYINTIKNNTIRIGNLKSILTYDKDGRVINRVIKKYLHDNVGQTGFEEMLAMLYSNQGKVSQSFNDFKVVTVTDPVTNNYAYAVTNLVEEYPAILQREESYDLLKGSRSEIQHIGFDFYSGIPTKQFYKDSYGNNYITETVPAYTKYPEMGLKVNTPSNRHMLSQFAASYVYKASANAVVLGTLSAEVTTWNKLWKYRMYNQSVAGIYYTGAVTDNAVTVQDEQIWRPYRNYVVNTPMLNKDGTIQNFVNFDWSAEANGQPQQKFWQKNSEVTLYDPFSNPLEAMDVNGNYSSAKFGYAGSEVLMTASNARYTEMAYSSAEDDAFLLDNTNDYSNYFGGEARGRSNRNLTYAHTGKYSMAVTTAASPLLLYFVNKNSSGRNDFDFSKKYRASVWVHKDLVAQSRLSYTLTNDADNSIISTSYAQGSTALTKAGDWYLLPLDFSIPSTSFASVSLKIFANNTAGGSVYFDDFRFHPAESTVSSYIYDPQTRQVTHILDNENFYTRFEYDPFGRLIATYKETINGEKKLNNYYYNFARKP